MKILHPLPYAPSGVSGRKQNTNSIQEKDQPRENPPPKKSSEVRVSLSATAPILMDRGQVARLWDENEARQRVLLAQSQLLTRAGEAVSIQANLSRKTALRLLS